MSGTDAIDRLHRIVTVLDAQGADTLARWLAAAIAKAEDGMPLERALGLTGTWRKQQACARRAEALRRIFCEHFPSFKLRAAARVIYRRPDLLELLPAGARGSESTLRNALARSLHLVSSHHKREDLDHGSSTQNRETGRRRAR